MKIFLLRHQERYDSISFMTSLNERGKLLAEADTRPKLERLQISQIYSSPFLRTLQTVRPFLNVNSHSKNINVKMEYGLYEVIHNEYFNINTYLNVISQSLFQKYHIDSNYRSIVEPYEIKYGECQKDVFQRIMKVLQHIAEKYSATDENILLVSHQGVLHSILRLCEMGIPLGGMAMGQIIEIPMENIAKYLPFLLKFHPKNIHI